jgi:hypothetical protein
MAGRGLRVEGVLRSPGGEEFVAFFEVPRAQAGWVTRKADPFVVLFARAMMKLGAPVRVHGEVSACLLDRLEEYQRIVARWQPQLGQPVAIQADRLARPRRPPRQSRPLLAFSGGTDSLFTAWNWSQPGRASSRLAWAVMAQGFDVDQDAQAFFARQLAEGREALATRGISLFGVRTNCMWMSGMLGLKWGIAFHGPATAALLLLFQRRFEVGLISSTYVSEGAYVPWGSTPTTDPLLGGGDMGIVHVGSASERIMKLKELLAWPEGLARMRVCYRWPREEPNCGVCYKCRYVRTLLAVLGAPEATPFPGAFGPETVRTMDLEDALNVRNWVRMLRLVEQWTTDSPWLGPIREAVARGKSRYGEHA